MAFHVPEEFRLKKGNYGSDESYGNNGVFLIPAKRYTIKVICSDGIDWEHVSVTLSNNRMPNWTEMCAVKDIFWDKDDAVMQIHPPQDAYVNNHPNCLHLWRPVDRDIPLPPEIMVGVPGAKIRRKS